MCAQLPTEVWLHVAKFIPEDEMGDLVGINRLFFNLAMDARYQEIEFDDVTPKALKTIYQLSDPTIARRVRRLALQLNHFSRLRNTGVARSSTPTTRRIIDRLTTAILHPHLPLLNFRPVAANNTKPASFADLIDALATVMPGLINVEEFSVDSWNLPTAFNLQPFFSAAWLGFGTKVQKLSLGGSIEGFRVLLASQPVLTAVEEFHFEFTDNMNPPRPNSAEALTAAAETQALLHNFVVPFINSHADRLCVLEISSWASIDLSSFFKLLGPFPLLRRLSVWAAFNRSFTNDPSGLAEILHETSTTLKELRLRLNPAGLFDSEADLLLSQWLSGIVRNNDRWAIGLRTLEIYPSNTEAGLDTLALIIQRSTETLERLYIRDRYLIYPEIVKISKAFSPYARLGFLRLNVRKLPVGLLDIFAQHFPNLQSLTLRAADGEPAADFVRDIRTRVYTYWKLYDIGIWQGGNELEIETMLIIAECIPSVRSFWGQGHTRALKLINT